MSEPLEDQILLLLHDDQRWDAYRLIIEAHGPGVRGYLRASTRSDFHGDELYRQMEDRLVESLPELGSWLLGQTQGYSGRRTVRAWLYKVARRLVIDWQRRYSVQHNAPLRTGQEFHSPLPTPTEQLAESEQRRLIDEALEQLTDAERDVYILRKERDFSHAEIGEMLDISADAAKQRYANAIKRLKALLGDKK
jgi:RNA polymerase sigma-70 factor (ECF subfamily)